MTIKIPNIKPSKRYLGVDVGQTYRINTNKGLGLTIHSFPNGTLVKVISGPDDSDFECKEIVPENKITRIQWVHYPDLEATQ